MCVCVSVCVCVCCVCVCVCVCVRVSWVVNCVVCCELCSAYVDVQIKEYGYSTLLQEPQVTVMTA